ncbi:MAG: protoheme IX farnesyltransferase [Ignavibacteriales bacterium]|nr:MAG: protoheme IX farnesyltransferase [Ignavibacteriales bacterium]
MKSRLKILAELTKIRITIFVTVTMVFGFISAAGEINSRVILPALGLLLLACGSAAVNHYQERFTDALMDRTKNRPIPSKRISERQALWTASLLVLTGSLLIYLSAGMIALILGLLNLIWYNIIYTPLKKVTAMAIIPGSLVGAIPPAVGWVAGGGLITDPQLFILSFFFFIWQIPHFWLLVLVLDKDYERAGFPTLTQKFSEDQLTRITFIWIIATAVTSVLIPLFGLVQNEIINFGLFIAGSWLSWNSFKFLMSKRETLSFRFAFKEINIFALTVVVLLSVDKLFIIF